MSEKFHFSIFSWTKWKEMIWKEISFPETPCVRLRNLLFQSFLERSEKKWLEKKFRFRKHRVCVRVFICEGANSEFWLDLGKVGSLKNGSNDFPKSWYTPSLRVGLSIDDVIDPVKTIVSPLGGLKNGTFWTAWRILTKFFSSGQKFYLKKLLHIFDPKSPIMTS